MIYKDEAVAQMTALVQEMNKAQALEQGMPLEQVNAMFDPHTPDINRINGLLYDKLVEIGVIGG